MAWDRDHAVSDTSFDKARPFIKIRVLNRNSVCANKEWGSKRLVSSPFLLVIFVPHPHLQLIIHFPLLSSSFLSKCSVA